MRSFQEKEKKRREIQKCVNGRKSSGSKNISVSSRDTIPAFPYQRVNDLEPLALYFMSE